MTKEELKKEAEEWLRSTDNHLNEEKTHFLSESEYAERAYLAGAEPREKRIEELEGICKDLSDKFDYQVKQVMKLEKENAELKGLVNQYKASKCGSISLVNRNMIMFDQLTKAKFLLKQLVDAFPKSYSDVVKDTLEEAIKFVEE